MVYLLGNNIDVDPTLQNSPLVSYRPYGRYLMFCFGDPLTILAYRNLHGANFACATCNQLLQALSN